MGPCGGELEKKLRRDSFFSEMTILSELDQYIQLLQVEENYK